ncbi:ABC transporter permease [Haloarchaeobius sp. DFWS5]|uniref:ABC transporter permease n=1 Tax=Haloarchaeobius sp. DFWS5 TaxID=3446114 RepID=UPI003EBB4E37
MSDSGWKAYLQRLLDASYGERLLISLAALAMAVVVGGVVVFLAGWPASCAQGLEIAGQTFCYNPVYVYMQFFLGSVGLTGGGWSPTNIAMGLLLRQTVLLMFTGLSVAVAFRAGMFNIGTQGQLVLGALATPLTVIAVAPYAPSGIVGTLILVPVGLFAGAVAGGIWGAIPGALKAYADANEVITTIMLNFVALSLATTLVKIWFQDPGASGLTATKSVPENAMIPTVLFDSNDGVSLLALGLAVALAVGVTLVLTRTSFGFDLRVSGVQPDAATYGGVDAEKTMVSSMAISGALGGIGGAIYVLMLQGRWASAIPSLGFDGITVSILAGNNPLGVGLSALLFGVFKSGSAAIESSTDVPSDLLGVLTGLIILFVAMPEFFRMLGRRFVTLDDDDRAVATDGGTATSGGESDE